jgi:4-alpha-glucanotransferase
MSDEVVRDLARRAGIAVEWQDYAGQSQVVAPPVLRRILAALGLPADASRELSSSRRLLTKRSSLADLPPLVTAVAGRPTRLDVGGSEAQPADLVLENGETRQVALLPARGRLRIPAIAETGYHRLRVEDREIVLAVSPARCRSIEDVVPDARLWGLAAQLYGLSHPGDVGIGDLAGFLNPLHAAPGLVFGSAGTADVQSVNGLIDWPSASAAKYALLRKLFESCVDCIDWD